MKKIAYTFKGVTDHTRNPETPGMVVGRPCGALFKLLGSEDRFGS